MTVPLPVGVAHVPASVRNFVVVTPSAENKSEMSMARKVGVWVEVRGPAKNVFALCVISEGVRVPADVTGVPADAVSRIPSPVNDTDVTVPPPTAATVDQTPSPRRNVVGPGVPVAGISEMVIRRATITPPVDARIVWSARPVCDVIAMVPRVVIGDPETTSQLGTVTATDVTVPVPGLGKG